MTTQAAQTTQAAGVPRVPFAALGVLMLAALVAVAAMRLTTPLPDGSAVSPAVNTRALRFEDRADGSIAVLDAERSTVIDTVAPGTNGFLRSAMRGLVRERKRRGLGDEVPFELVAHVDGRLTLLDPGTGRRIDLESFGPTNAGAFARLLPGTAR